LSINEIRTGGMNESRTPCPGLNLCHVASMFVRATTEYHLPTTPEEADHLTAIKLRASSAIIDAALEMDARDRSPCAICPQAAQIGDLLSRARITPLKQ